jgi:GWxTD domain-containing protein
MKYIIVFLVFVFNLSYLNAQKGFGAGLPGSEKDNFFFNYMLNPAKSNDSLNYTIMFKISHSVLAFNKSDENRRGVTFSAKPIVEIVFKDSEGIIRERQIWSDTISVSSFDETNDKHLFTGDFIKTRLKKSDYEVKISLLDKYNQKINNYNFSIKSDFNDKHRFSYPLIIKKDGNVNKPLIFNQNLEFTSKTFSLYFLTYKQNENFSFSITKLDDQNENKFYWDKKINYKGNAEIIDAYPDVYQNGRLPEIDFTNFESSDYKYAKIEIPSYDFVPGKYQLTLGVLPDTTNYYIYVKWFNKPHSLMDIEYALESLKYILTDKEYDDMDSRDNAEIFNNIISYWSKKDPTPATPYNEAMTEYFRRVDYAGINYKTIKEKNGMRTERGKIYILFGPPTTVNTELKDESTYEIWDYENRVNKIFTFEMFSAGIYRLTEIKDKGNQ